MKTLEEIAKGVAEGFRVSLEVDGRRRFLQVRVKGHLLSSLSYLHIEAARAGGVSISEPLKPHVRAAIMAALREALAVPGEPPVDDEIIELTRTANDDPHSWESDAAASAIGRLLAQLEYYQRLAALLMREREGAAYAAGYDAGVRSATKGARHE